MSQGTGSMNGLGTLIDKAGTDRYRALSGQGHGNNHPTGYWGGRNAGDIGILVDLGKSDDQYTISARSDSTAHKKPGVGLFLDR